MLKTSITGICLIKGFEGLRLRTYKCPAGIDTIGYGHTGKEAYPGNIITSKKAEKLLRNDLTKYEDVINKLVTVELSQSQFDALVSFVYNLGPSALKRSTLLKLLNRGDYSGAAGQFTRWNKAGGKILPGLIKRRCREALLFLT